METNYIAMMIAAVAAFVWSTLYYLVLNKLTGSSEANNKPPAWKLGAEIVRNFGFVFILAHVFAKLGVIHVSDGLRHSFWLWLAFPVVLFAGTSMWEDMSWKTAVSHMGDWLVKMALIASILVALA